MTVHRRKDLAKAGRGEHWRRVAADLVDPDWYRAQHRDAMSTGLDPLAHFLRYGIEERRDPNEWFDGAWYAADNPDINPTGLDPLTHYIYFGAAELRKPHARFDPAYYVKEHPDAAENPLLYHMLVGRMQGYRTENCLDSRSFLPSESPAFMRPSGVAADVIIAIAQDVQQAKRCLNSLMADNVSRYGRIIVVDNAATEPALSRWLRKLATEKKIVLLRNNHPVAYATALNQAIEMAAGHDVVVLSGRIEVPNGWLNRLVAQAYAEPGIATVSPFSNEASWCGYPDIAGGAVVFDRPLAVLDRACMDANPGRFVSVPSNPAFCLYIRRQALLEAGVLDAKSQPWNTEFCLRASAAGWRHHLACDTFVHSDDSRFAPSPARTEPDDLSERYPNYASRLAIHTANDPAAPFRFAITAALFRSSGLPVILMVSHAMGGGIRRHIDSIIEHVAGAAYVLLLEGSPERSVLSVPVLPGHPVMAITANQTDELEAVLRSANVSRVHIHHTLNIQFDLAGMIRRLGVPFDITVHDYFAICPQINLLPRPVNLYCGMPGPATCNACIGISPSAFRARDILTWRQERAWQFKDADRVICPSNDVRQRLTDLGLTGRAIVVPHDSVAQANWPLSIPKLSGNTLRVVLLGTLAMHKGSMTVAEVAMTAEPGTLDIHCIGYLEDTFPESAAPLIKATGPYDDEELPRLLRDLRPHVVWLPSAAPETYSYTLSAAIDAGLPIVATDFGAFRERTDGRPFTWLVDYRAPATSWLDTFQQVRVALKRRPLQQPSAPRPQIPDFYGTSYLASPRPPARRKARRDTPIVAVVAERFDSGHLSPCAFIRLLHPLDHPEIGDAFKTNLDDAESVLVRRADIIITQRHAIPDMASADALVAHARRIGAKLVFDLDDDLVTIPPNHPDAGHLRPKSKVVRFLLDEADTVWLSSPGLAKRLARIRPDAVLIENGLDERIWAYGPAPPRFQPDPLRILCMGSGTHHADLALIMPSLVRLNAEYAERVVIDIIGMSDDIELPRGIRRLSPPLYATQSYPAFVNWINTVPERWHIGLAPLLDTPFNRCKSPIKAMDYAAMGMVVLASDIPVYRGSLADGPAGHLVANDPLAWFDALERLLRDQDLRQTIAARAREMFLGQASLASQAPLRRLAWKQII